MSISFFTIQRGAQTEVLVPEPVAGSGWGAGQMRGMAVSGALARAVERAVVARGRADLRPVRFTLDLFRPAAMQPCVATATVIREGRRLALLEATLEQSGQAVARASAIFLRAGESPAGAVWSAGQRPLPPPAGLTPVPLEPRLHYSDDAGWTTTPAGRRRRLDDDAGWTTTPAGHQNSSRKQVWHYPVPVVRDEPLSPFQLVASVADVTNLVTNWGTAGLTFINADLTLLLARLPVVMEVGLAAVDHVERDGIAVGTAVVYDREGPLGTAAVSAVANADRAVDLANRVVDADEPSP